MTVSYLVECDGCRAAYITAGQLIVEDALAYIGSRGWSVVAKAKDIRTLCPRCTRQKAKN